MPGSRAGSGPYMAESEIIGALTPAVGSAAVRVGIGDDAAVLADGTLVTVDAMVEGVHFDARLSPADVGWKLVAVNVSDIAAMGGRPTWATLALSLPDPPDRTWVAGFAEGLAAACRNWNVTLVGGDTTRSPIRAASLTLGGAAVRPVLRSTARAGDDLWVTGRLGLAAEALLSPSPTPDALAHLRRPAPRVAFACALADLGVTAMIDLSDGLSDDLSRLCTASGCGAEVDPDAVPGSGPLAWRVAFGEDYELLFTASAADRDALRSVADMYATPLSLIGRLDARPDARMSGMPWPAPLFRHFTQDRG